MTFLDYLHRERSGASSYFTPSPSSRSDGLPSLAGASIASSSSTPRSIQTPQSVNVELPTVKLPSYSELISRLGDLDMDHSVDHFNSFKQASHAVVSVATVDPRATPSHCVPSYSYSPPQRDSLFGSSATHYQHRQACCSCQPHYHPSAPFSHVSHDFDPSSTLLRAVSPTHTHAHAHDYQHPRPHTHTHANDQHQWSPASSIPSSSNINEDFTALESSSVTSKPKPVRRIRVEQPMSKSRQAFQTMPRTTIKPARSKSTKLAPGTPKAKRLPAHPMPHFAALFPKGIRNYTGVPRDKQDERENYFSDAELMEMMPSGYQRWQDAINRYKAPTHTETDLTSQVVIMGDSADLGGSGLNGDPKIGTVTKTVKKDNKQPESWERFARIAEGKFGNHGEQLYQCKAYKKGGDERFCARKAHSVEARQISLWIYPPSQQSRAGNQNMKPFMPRIPWDLSSPFPVAQSICGLFHLLRTIVGEAVSSLNSSPSSRSDGLPFLSGSTPPSTPQSMYTPQSVNGEFPTVTLPSYSDLIARLGSLDMDHAVARFKSYTPPPLAMAIALVDPRLTPPNCAPSFSYSPPPHHSHSGTLSATCSCGHHPCCQPRCHTLPPFNDPFPDSNPDPTRLRTISPAHYHNECHTHNRQWSPAPSISIATPTTTSSPSSSDVSYEYVPDGYEHVPELESGGVTVTKPKLRRVRREQPMSKSRQAFQATPRTTIKPMRSKSAPSRSSSSRAPMAKRLPSHPMPVFATLFPKGVRNYTGVPRDAQDDRENYFGDEELMDMMPSGYQRWQDAVNRYKPSVHSVDEHLEVVKIGNRGKGSPGPDGAHVPKRATRRSKKKEEPSESFPVEPQTYKHNDDGVTVWQCRGFFLEDCKTPCKYRQTKQAVKRHINDTHFGFRPWPCPFSNCEKTFKQRMSMCIHAYSVHTRQKPFFCNHCPKQFSDPAQRHDHCKIEHKHIPMITRKKKAYSSDEDEESDVRASDYGDFSVQKTMNIDADVDELKGYCSGGY
ncbi:hypothetical protein D9619_001144 [Psilocybe cf. subviscida]|uniref:C2H2-type domain-containing protein n=1 Tax=Psilocybe cf. subviscida TaxID=2480587 RepID=A0A8H5F3R3_9AGAR|nr:hypothetical protein D9619_001144 [Psilocybe cf. subviscida]